MPNEYARSGFHSGETASGYFDEGLAIAVNDVDLTRQCRFDALDVYERADDAPNTCDLALSGLGTFLPAAGLAVQSRVQAGNTASATSVASPAQTHTAGRLLVALIKNATGDLVSGVSDLGGNTWTKAGTTFAGGSYSFVIYYAKNILGFTNNVVTAAFSSGAIYRSITVYEISGADTSAPLGDIQTGLAASGTAVATATLSVTAAQEIILAHMTEDNGAGIVGGSGYTLVNYAITGDANPWFSDEYHIVTASEAATATRTSGSFGWRIQAASFKAALPTGITLTAGQSVKIFNGGLDVGVPIFSGRVMRVKASAARSCDQPVYQLDAVDHRWLLDRYKRVTKSYYSQGINAILADIIANYTNSGFTVGYCPMSLGNLDQIHFTQETITGCMRRLARAAGAIAAVDYRKRCSIYVTPDDEGNALTLTDSATDFWDVGIDGDITQVRTRIIYEGGGSDTASAVSAGATVLPVTNTIWYSAAGGTVRSGTNLITYTGVSTGSGAGSITGCSGIITDLPANQPVNVYVQADDAAAQTAFATLLGGGASGIAVQYVADGRLSLAECTTRATDDLAFYKAQLSTIQYTTTNAYTRAGRSVAVTLTKPIALTNTLRVQSMRLRGRRAVVGASLKFDRLITASPAKRQLADALVELGVA